MEDFIAIYKLLTSNWEGIMVAVVACVGAVAKVATILNIFMPKVITNKHLARIEAVSSKLSLGTKKAEVIKK